ncbi:xanthine dehydrogenase family protein subunit M [Sphingobacterium sp. SRCM116780]|uniref:FAD binding domain-containing protein n=1 Tax=Sphingobacterium sp. SRCM116780 TaxID=2907623 RepID=UPI001F1E47E4|nr:xanthine dehydrogenase family protein subunit M [Sphingobacterium sp. SRCM116780]UIR56847.1 xanthine dehydrogenase family protein subunit M [Sphingobacterium sp. SRCM116780]
MRPFDLKKVDSPKTALTHKKDQVQFIAGGTNLVDLMKKNISQPDTLLDIATALSSTIEKQGAHFHIGAMTRNTTIATDWIILEHFPLLAKAVLAGASPQIRNMASTAGNLLQRTRCPYFYDSTTACNKRKPGSGCSAYDGQNRMSAVIGYSKDCVAVHPSDLCIALVALDAKVHVTHKDQKKSVIAFQDFHRLPGNEPHRDNTLPEHALITSVELTANAIFKHCAYVKVRDRDSYAFALVSVAAALQLDGDQIVEARLASGGVAHKPWRWLKAEQFLKGKKATASIFSEAAELIVSDLKPLSHNGFKIPMLKGAVETALSQCLTV